MSKGETTVLGVNTSHDTAVAVVVDGEVKHVYEEERSRRAKYWSPRDDSSEGDNGVSYDEMGLLCIDHKQLHSPDYLAFASFDRRDFHITVHDRVFRDRLLQQEMVANGHDVVMLRYSIHRPQGDSLAASQGLPPMIMGLFRSSSERASW